jgi:hypothetical protein
MNATPAVRVLVPTLLSVQVALLSHGCCQNAAVVDETSHIAAGVSHWQTGTHSMYRVNPPLPRMLAVLPVLFAEPETRGISPIDMPGVRAEWSAGLRFARENAGRHQRLVRLARLAGIGWTVLGGWLIYSWVHELYGVGAACLGLALWCFEPNVLAYGGFVLPDLPAAVAALAASYVFWGYLRTSSWLGAWFVGLTLGIAELTKFTLVILFAVWPVLWVIYRLRPPTERAAPIGLRTELGQGFVILVLSLLVLNLGYGFEKSGEALGEIPFTSGMFVGDSVPSTVSRSPGISGNRFRGTWLGELPVPLPADYLRGIDVQRRDFEELGKTTASYLVGEWRETGWWYYYIYALAIKVSLGLWGLLLGAVGLGLCRCFLGSSGSADTSDERAPQLPRSKEEKVAATAWPNWRDECCVWLPALAILALVSSQTGFNHHMRYVLPVVPFVIVYASKVGWFLQPQRWKASFVVLALVLWAVGSSLAIHPHYVSYFNELVGGADHGGEYLLDSNIDDGQDLLFLKRWLEEHPEARPISLAYYGPLDPRLEGIDYMLPPVSPMPGYHVLSVNYLYGSQLVHAPDGHGGWTGIGREQYAYFRRWKPIAKAGYGLFIYHVTPEAAGAARHDMGLPPLTGVGVARHD